MTVNAQVTMEPYSFAEDENFREIEQLFLGMICVAAAKLPATSLT